MFFSHTQNGVNFYAAFREQENVLGMSLEPLGIFLCAVFEGITLFIGFFLGILRKFINGEAFLPCFE